MAEQLELLQFTEEQLELFPEARAYLPPDIPLEILYQTRERIGYQLNYLSFWSQYRNTAKLKNGDDLIEGFSDFCQIKQSKNFAG